jgi:AcrR family transcriptional regulator
MARKPDPVNPASGKSDRERIIEAFMALAAERPFSEIGFTEIAARSGVPLGRCRAEFDSVVSILSAQMQLIDRAVLDGSDADMVEETPRERLFDVLMRRLEALAPHKAAIRSITRAARCNPPLALALNCLTVRSQQWMLTAAGISGSGLRGGIRAQGMACIYADVLRTWLDDDDPGLARTMAALDRGLARGQRWSRCLDDLCERLPNPCRPGRWRPRDRHANDPGEQPAVV